MKYGFQGILKGRIQRCRAFLPMKSMDGITEIMKILLFVGFNAHEINGFFIPDKFPDQGSLPSPAPAIDNGHFKSAGPI